MKEVFGSNLEKAELSFSSGCQKNRGIEMAKRILLIEDDPDFLRMMYQILVEEGYEVAVASRTDMAKRWVMDKEIGFDMIISDQRMPGELGASFLSFVEELEKTPTDKIESAPIYQEMRQRFSKLSDDEYRAFVKGICVKPHIRVILSGYAEDGGIQKALDDKKIHKFISKKTPITDILGQIKELLG